MKIKFYSGLLVGALFFLYTQNALAQINIGGKPYSFSQRTKKEVPPPVLMPAINLSKLKAEDIVDEQAGKPPRFGDPIKVNLNMNNSGVWETLPDGGRVWRLSIKAEGAKSINLLYNDFYLPSGAVLYIYSSDRKHLIGGFTSANNKRDRVFATGLVYSDLVILEYYESKKSPDNKHEFSEKGNPSININYVVHGYRHIQLDPKGIEKAFDDSGNCNVNTICAQGDNWRDEIKSVALMLVGGTRWCTGYLVNNTAEDCRPLFLTANHCLTTFDAITNPNANTFSFVWRYESPNCTPDTDGPTNLTTSGATVIANPGSPGDVVSSDFALLELAESPKDAEYDVYFAGFDASSTAPASSTGIHHPAGDVKKISMENNLLTATEYGGTGGTPTHWRIADWDSGTTEGGSSGSPIFSNASNRAIGFLSGGQALCGNNLPDWYGQMAYSWNNNGATDSRRRLMDHLDPGGLATFVDGSADPCEIAMPSNEDCVTAQLLESQEGEVCGTTIGADADLPNGGVDCVGNADAYGHGVWYTIIGDGNIWELYFPEDNENWDPEVNVYSGSCASLTCVTGNDDYFGYDAFVSINTIAGTVYYVYVHDASSEGQADFCFTLNVVENCDLLITNLSSVGESCPNTNNGSITISATSSSGPITYTISGPANQNNLTGIFTGLPDGNYSITVTDNEACTETSTVIVAVGTDNTPPNITCPGTQTLTLGSNCSATVPNYTGMATTNDNCGIQSVTQLPAAGSTSSGAGNLIITLTVTDVNGLTNSCSFTVTKVDNTPPTVQCSNQTINFNGEMSIPLNANSLAHAQDGCGIQSIISLPSSINSNQVGQTVPVLVTVTDVNGNTATCTSQITVGGLPPGWSENINGVGCSNGNNIEYNAATQIWTATSTNCYYTSPFTSDETAFAQRTLCENGSITAQVTGISGNALGWAGVVMRESDAAGAKKAQLTTNMAGNQSRREFRLTTNGSAVPQNFPAQNRFWMRIERIGNQFTLYNSPNGVQWFPVGTQTIVMGSCVQMGLVATNYTSNSTVTATFANVSFTGAGVIPSSSQNKNENAFAFSHVNPDFRIYPNPSSGELNLDLKQYLGKNVQIELYGLEGKLMQLISLDEVLQNTQTMLLDRYSSGMYFVKLKSAGLPDVTKRIVLNKG